MPDQFTPGGAASASAACAEAALKPANAAAQIATLRLTMIRSPSNARYPNALLELRAPQSLAGSPECSHLHVRVAVAQHQHGWRAEPPTTIGQSKPGRSRATQR